MSHCQTKFLLKFFCKFKKVEAICHPVKTKFGWSSSHLWNHKGYLFCSIYQVNVCKMVLVDRWLLPKTSHVTAWICGEFDNSHYGQSGVLVAKPNFETFTLKISHHEGQYYYDYFRQIYLSSISSYVSQLGEVLNENTPFSCEQYI